MTMKGDRIAIVKGLRYDVWKLNFLRVLLRHVYLILLIIRFSLLRKIIITPAVISFILPIESIGS